MNNIKMASAMVALLASSAFAAGNDSCKVLPAEKFSEIMGYKATILKNASTPMSCFYQGPGESGGQFTIITENASGPGADAMTKGRGSAPPAGSGLIGGTFKQGSILFSISIKSTDQAKVQALATEIKRNLK
jgi:hypothetical protein